MSRFAPLALTFALAVACDDDDAPVVADLCGFSCDDGDFCTEDRCDTTDATCIHVPRDAANACTMDRHCDDGDPCTTDACAADAECGFMRCRHEFIPGCRSCVGFNSCDDDNHCTLDQCGADLLCDYVDEPDCSPRCRMWTPDFQMASNAQAGDVVVMGRAEPRGGRSCGTSCTCTPDLTLFDDYGSVTIDDAEGTWACTIEGACEPTTQTVACEPLQLGREYLVWGMASADRDSAGAAPRADTAPQVDTSQPPGTPASRMLAEGYCLAPSELGLIGRYAATLALDGESTRAFEVELSTGSVLQIFGADGVVAHGWFEWSTYSVSFYMTMGQRVLRTELFPGTDRLVGPVSDPNQRANDAKPGGDPALPREPPGSVFGKRIGKMTLVLMP